MSEGAKFNKLPIFTQPAERNLTPSELREKLRDPNFLPTRSDISRAFESGKEWNDFCENKEEPVFEFLNEEFITAFSNYLVQRVGGLGAPEDSPITILEVGAGNGRLAHFLQQKLEAKLPGKVKVVAIDSNNEWSLKPAFPVEKIDHKTALQKYKPKIVIFSWMPTRDEVTTDFRATDSVEEYILIGEVDGGCSGDGWETWGKPTSLHEKNMVAPYIADGFEREDLDDISQYQIGRTDKPRVYGNSQTVSFRREV